MTATIVVFAVLLAALAWLFWGARAERAGVTPARRPGETEEAEREVMEAESEDEVRDWGPGAGKPRPPELL